ncbi:hypothetical protein AK88_02987 [Plasmodium fragile]|uniref:Plasmodium RESA N-terminal domain-containing protein n=1 Tax=Plasmodium fragile TaxID=5857 RepID=A0A0D9QKJ0_PLAFR|nr:uncharacterized protein AK88_02987 [Plasmodium fragile]KJP87307.1 hypothetical protein AK88_02987 [Plasmodium fragile]
MMFALKLSIFSFILYSWQDPEKANECGTSWKHWAKQHDTLGVRISRLLTVELDMQAPPQPNNTLLLSPGKGQDKKVASRKKPGQSGKPKSKVGEAGSLPPSSQNEEQSQKGENKPQEPSLKGGADWQTPEQSHKLPGNPSGDFFKEPLVRAKEKDAKDNAESVTGATKVPGPETTRESDEQVGVKRHDVLADAIYDDVSTVPKSHHKLGNDNKKRQGRQQQRMGKGYTIEKYEGTLAEDREKYGIHRSIAFHYEMSCFDERLRDSEINKKLEQMKEEPHTWELLSLYWQSYRNERSKYRALKKSLKEKLLELQKKQTIATPDIYNKKWKKCEEIINNNLTKQHEHVSDVFYTMVAKEKLSRDEFEKILYDFRESWKEVTLKTADECIAIIGEPISLEVIYHENDPNVFGMRVPGFTVPGMPYDSNRKLDTSVGAERSSQVSQNEEQAETAEKKAQECSLDGGTDIQTPHQSKKLPGDPSGGPLKEPVPGTNSGKSKTKDGSEGLVVASEKKAHIKETSEQTRGLCSTLARTLSRNKWWIPATLAVLGVYIATLPKLPKAGNLDGWIASLLIVIPGIALTLLVVLFWSKRRKGRSGVPKKALKDKISSDAEHKTDVSKKSEAPKTPETPEKTEARIKAGQSEKQDAPKTDGESEKSETPKNPEAPGNKEAPKKQDVPKKAGESEKPETPKETEVSKKP